MGTQKTYYGLNHVFTNRSQGDTIYLNAGPHELLQINGLGLLSLSNTDEATSTTTGSLILPGGFGIAKNVNVGRNLTTESFSSSSFNVSGVTTVKEFSAGNHHVPTSMSELTLRGTLTSTGVTTGTLVTYGGLGSSTFSASNSNLTTETLSAVGISIGRSFVNMQHMYNFSGLQTQEWYQSGTEESSSITTGAMRGVGDMNIAGPMRTPNLYAGGVTNFTDTTNATVGSLYIPSGGMAVVRDLYIGNNTYCQEINGSWLGDRVTYNCTYIQREVGDDDPAWVMLKPTSATHVISVPPGLNVSNNSAITISKAGTYLFITNVKVTEALTYAPVGYIIYLQFNGAVEGRFTYFNAMRSSNDDEVHNIYTIKKMAVNDYMQLVVDVLDSNPGNNPLRINAQCIVSSLFFD